MTPIDKLIKIIDRDLCYGVSELVEKCSQVGMVFTNRKFYHDIAHGRLRATRLGDSGHYQVSGSDFLDTLLTNETK